VINGIHHVGLSFVDIDRSIVFYRDMLGMEMLGQSSFVDTKYGTIMALEGATGRAAMLKTQDLQVELFEFAHPEPRSSDPDRPVSDHGITHFCMKVTDLDGEFERLEALGMRFHCAPLTFRPGLRATYGRDPDGNVIELLEDTR
jgi:catechol 2,3-dioxygenase-like lactoylglutathione lyase family enzyme